MSKAFELAAEAREERGKGAARELRRNGMIPAVVYGAGKEPVSISIDQNTLKTEYYRGGFYNRLVDLKIGKDTVRVLPKEIQLHPVTDMPEHVDFLRVDEKTRVKVQVNVNFHNREKCPGLRRGGVLNVVRHEVEVFCTPDSIPDSLDFDLVESKIGDSIHISQIKLPEGVEPTINDRDFTVATIVGRGKGQEEETAAAEGEEGETAAETEE